MLKWNPIWEKEVDWDDGKASDAANELRRAANLLQATWHQRQSAAGVAQQEWRGGHRQKFDRDLEEMLKSARQLAEEMRNKAKQIDDATEEAQQERRYRKHMLDQYRREKAEEKRKEIERQEQEWKN